ncbi:Mg-protoporphyrin IX methyl transferase [Pigmentiphaga humi]|uniref:Mg-protoporphyrin IX methyl transferase n=1 Tax=Pigmentiphaga humi TaxID=2478468 RepID=A0A3P4B2T1_9BURK|nr:class I SAM-dependent methyltransferase [Pigmentiphaga humi]VCU70201.1 Mg-protoporphyrin IX methyl transferase [Pigmentiphaga humi]
MMLAPLRSSPQFHPSHRFACLRRARAGAAAVSLALSCSFAAAAAAQEAASGSQAYVPQVGQQGKDVVWVPTPQALVDKMLEMAQATPADNLLDLGSGDGRTVITAAGRGIRAHGIEYNPEMADLARRNAAAAGVADRATFATADLFESNLSGYSVITMFLLPAINDRLRPRLLELKPGTRIVSNSFPMGEWAPDQQATVGGDCQTWCTALLWIVPAQIGGNWKLGGQELKLEQTFQQVSGTLGGEPLRDVVLRGDEISFRAGTAVYRGKVDGNTMEGERSKGAPAWRATRA